MTDATDLAIGERFRQWREAAGLRQEQVATAARARGLTGWTQATVAAIELGRRELSLAEFVALRGARVRDRELAAFFRGARSEEVNPETAARLAAEKKAAKSLGVEPADVVALSRRLWGRTLTEERDARVRAYIGIGGVVELVDRGRKAKPPRARVSERYKEHARRLRARGVITMDRMAQARRGHVTRALVAELRAELERSASR